MESGQLEKLVYDTKMYLSFPKVGNTKKDKAWESREMGRSEMFLHSGVVKQLVG